jgi:hypothetical protein
MHASGAVDFGGIGFGGLTCDLTCDDGSRYHFTGYCADIGAGNAAGTLEGDFEGLSHILGSCAFTLEHGGIGPGGIAIQWWDFHGTIGTIEGFIYGAVINLGIGGGTWTAVSSEKQLAEIRGGSPSKDLKPTT